MPSETEIDALNRLTEALVELNKAGEEAHKFGLHISDKAIAAMNELPNVEQRVELALWLAKPENYDSVTHPLMSLSEDKQAEKIKEYAKREDVVGSIRDGDTEDWIDKRREDKRNGKRR